MTPAEEREAAISAIRVPLRRAHYRSLMATMEARGTKTISLGAAAKLLGLDTRRTRAALYALVDEGVVAHCGGEAFKPLPWRSWRRDMVGRAGARVYGRPLPALDHRPTETPPLAAPAVQHLLRNDPFWVAVMAASGEGVTIHHLAHARAAEIAIYMAAPQNPSPRTP